MSIAVSYDDEEMIRMIYDFYLKSRIEKVKKNNANLANYLRTMKDLYIELKWKVSIPILSFLCPNDVIKIWKSKDEMRADFTFVDFKNLRVVRNLTSILLYCAADLLAAEYDRRFVSDKNIYAETEELLGEIKASMRESFDNVKWDYPYNGKEFMEKKLDYIKVYVGRNGDYNDLSDVELSEDPVDNAVALAVSQERFERKQLKKNLDDRTMTGMNMFETNAYYVPRLNSVMVNSAWLSMYSDLKEKELQGDGLQYEETLAWLGEMIAHEIGHAYSLDSGHYYNYRGINGGGMSDREGEQYDAFVDGIIQFFDGMEVEYGCKLDGELVSNETFADLMAMGCCLRMLEQRDDPDFDLFFRSYAKLEASNYTKSIMKELIKDTHLPNKERINYILAQFDEFYDTYDIDPESPYYVAPENRLKGFW